jgi:hypothetical protein
MFAEYVAGRSQQAINRGLREDKVPTSQGGEWHQGTVRMILANPVYMKLGIIDTETWAKVERMRTAAAKSPGGGRGRQASRHLFRKGMLRCGECGEAMMPRTDPNRASAPSEVYRCYGRHRDKDSCSMPPLLRAEIDDSVYRYFEQVGLDVEGTRASVIEACDRKIAEIRALLDQAEREARKAEDRFARVRRDYQDGNIEADDWAEQRKQLTAEHQAAKAEVERLRASEQEAADGGALIDAESEVLRWLAEIRRSVAGEVSDAASTDAVRAALTRLFKEFIVHRDLPEHAHVELIGRTWIEPIIREHSFESGDRLVPRLREPLDHADNKKYAALTR